MNGYIKSYRKIEDNPIVCKDNDYFRVWYYLLHNATHNEYEVLFDGKKILLKKGQLITGRKMLANKCNISESKAERILKMFKIEQQIEQQTSSKNRLITIVNWHLYQNSEQQIEQQVNNKWTTSEQQVDTNKNVKKINNVRNNNSSSSIYAFVENNLGRTLSPLEYEELSNWKDNELTRYAIKKAFNNGKYTLGYVKGILNNYEKNNITTIEQAQQEEENFKKSKNKKNNTKQYKTFSQIKREEQEEIFKKFLEGDNND